MSISLNRYTFDYGFYLDYTCSEWQIINQFTVDDLKHVVAGHGALSTVLSRVSEGGTRPSSSKVRRGN